MRRNAPFGDKSVRAFVRALTLTRLTGVDGIARQVYVRNATRRVPRGSGRARTGVWSVPSFEVVLRRPSRKDRIHYWNRPDAQIGDVVQIGGRPWVIVEKVPPFEFRRSERLICVPRRVRSTH